MLHDKCVYDKKSADGKAIPRAEHQRYFDQFDQYAQSRDYNEHCAFNPEYDDRSDKSIAQSKRRCVCKVYPLQHYRRAFYRNSVLRGVHSFD